MNSEQSMVREFHEAFDIPVATKPTNPDYQCVVRRKNLMLEELCELVDAMMKQDMVGIADGIADMLYVVYGTAVECGLDMEPIFKEIHRSNMTKVGGTKREDGKWEKPDTYSVVDLYPIIKAQVDG